MHADISIKTLDNSVEAEACASMMAGSDPWITLGRDYERCLQTVRQPLREVYLCYAGKQLAGFAILSMTGALVGYIQTICVSSRYRGRGLGTHIIGFAERRIFRDSPNVFMCVSSFNSRARSLYAALGYKVVGEFEDLLVRGHSEILLRKTLGPLDEFIPGGPTSDGS